MFSFFFQNHKNIILILITDTYLSTVKSKIKSKPYSIFVIAILNQQQLSLSGSVNNYYYIICKNQISIDIDDN